MVVMTENNFFPRINQRQQDSNKIASPRKTRRERRLSHDEYDTEKEEKEARAAKPPNSKPVQRKSKRTSDWALLTQSQPLSYSMLPTFGDVCRHVNYIMENVECVNHPDNRKRLIEEISQDPVSIWKHCQVTPRHTKG